MSEGWLGQGIGPRSTAVGWPQTGHSGVGDLLLLEALRRGSGEDRIPVLWALCEAVASPRAGAAAVELTHLLAAFPRLDAASWARELVSSPLVGPPGDGDSPFVWAGDALMTRRNWEYHRIVADRWALAFGGEPDEAPGDGQERALALSLRLPLLVVVGGPGTGKTHTLANILGRLEAAQAVPPLVALAAPTGRAAARLTEALRAADRASDWLTAQSATTLHRLLGIRPGSPDSPVYGIGNPLPHDLVIVDECSMVDLALMARLMQALRPDARLILVGDPDQLSSVEAGTVLADLVAADAGASRPRVVRLTRRHRFGEDSPVARLADELRAARVAGAVEQPATTLGEAVGVSGVHWVERRVSRLSPGDWSVLAAPFERLHGLAEKEASHAEALEELAAYRVLCLHRTDRFGSEMANDAMAAALFGPVRYRSSPPPGLPVMVTRNAPALGRFNGDLGLAVRRDADPERVWFAFVDLEAGVRYYAPGQLAGWEPALANTVHKSQGSQATHVSILLPDEATQLCTREALYTAVTRARLGATLVGPRSVASHCATNPTVRASILPRLLGSAV